MGGVIQFLLSAAGGPILGGFMQLVGSGVDEVKKWSESKRRIAELTALKEKQIAIGELEAFTKAQEGTLGSGYTPPAINPTDPTWQRAAFVFIHLGIGIVECVTRAIRPAMVIGACWYIWSLPESALGGLRGDILAVSFATIYFWLGIRHQLKSGGSK